MTALEVGLLVCTVSAIGGALAWGSLAYHDGFADGARWMAKGDEHTVRPSESWHRWPELKGLREGLREGWYKAARSYSKGMAPGEIEDTLTGHPRRRRLKGIKPRRSWE